MQVKQGGNTALGAVMILVMKFRVRTAKEWYEVEILSVLRELLGEAIHIVALNASTLGALLSEFIDRLKSHGK